MRLLIKAAGLCVATFRSQMPLRHQEDERKGDVLSINWAVFILVLCSVIFVFTLGMMQAYDPNHPSSAYAGAVSQIWLIWLITSFILSLILTIDRQSIPFNRMRKYTMRTYAVLTTVAVILLVNVTPVPAYFIQSVGDVDYAIPRSYTTAQSREHNVRIDLCIETLAGVYSGKRAGCDVDTVRLYPTPISEAWSLKRDIFFKDSEAFDLTNDQVIFRQGAEEYRIEAANNLKSYAILTSEEQPPYTVSIYFQVDEQDQLIRFVACPQYREAGWCEHIVKTPDGVLVYDISEPKDFNIELWEQREQRLLSLIAQWKIE